jgi:hypothetical protein
MSLCVVCDMAAREIESTREIDSEKARACARICTAFASCFASRLEARVCACSHAFFAPARAQTSNIEKQNQGRSIDLDGTNSEKYSLQ